MAAQTPGAEVADDELLYRRVPYVFYACGAAPKPPPVMAFRPTAQDNTGLSLARAKYMSLEQAAAGRPDRAYFICTLLAGELRADGIQVVQTGAIAHAELPQVTFAARRETAVVSIIERLARKHTRDVHGPYGPQAGFR